MIYQATVVDNSDVNQNGKIIVRFQGSPDSPVAKETEAEYCSPMGGGRAAEGAGFYMMPNVDDVVWIAFRGGSVNKPVVLGYAFSDVSSNNSIPVEARDDSQEPLNRVIKTKLGHTIELDDRFGGSTRTDGIRITSANLHKFSLSDAKDSVELKHKNGHKLRMTNTSVSIESATGAKLFLNDSPRNKNVLLQNSGAKSYIALIEDQIILSATNGVYYDTGQLGFTAESIISNKTFGDFSTKCSNHISSVGDSFSVSAGNKIKLASLSTFHCVFGTEGNFVVEGQSPGFTPGLGGMIQFETGVGGQILSRLNTVANIPPYVGTDVDTGTLSTGAAISIVEKPDLPTAARFGTGTTGTFLAESFTGALAITTDPLVGPGVVAPTPVGPMKAGGTIVATQSAKANVAMAAASIYAKTPHVSTYKPAKTGAHPLVLGDNLMAYLSEMHTFFMFFLTALQTNAATFSAGGAGANALSPVLVTLLGNMLTDLTAIQTMYLGVGGTLTGILSPFVFID